MSDWEVPEPKWLVPELEDEYQPEPFQSPGQIMDGSRIMDRIDEAQMREIMRRVI